MQTALCKALAICQQMPCTMVGPPGGHLKAIQALTSSAGFDPLCQVDGLLQTGETKLVGLDGIVKFSSKLMGSSETFGNSSAIALNSA